MFNAGFDNLYIYIYVYIGISDYYLPKKKKKVYQITLVTIVLAIANIVVYIMMVSGNYNNYYVTVLSMKIHFKC